MRQTSLSLKEILKRYKEGGSSEYPSCFLVNEICEIEKEGNVEARKTLLEILKSDAGDQEKFPAFCHLMSCEDKNEELQEALKDFINNPNNKDIVDYAVEEGFITLQ